MLTTPEIIFEHNTISACGIGIIAFSDLPDLSDKSNNSLSAYNVKLPKVSPIKTQRSFVSGSWRFNGNIIAGSTDGMTSVAGFYIAHITMFGPSKNGGGLTIEIENNVVENHILGLYIINTGNMVCQLSENTLRMNVLSLYVMSDDPVGNAVLNLNITDNQLLTNYGLGISVDSYHALHAAITGNTIDGGFFGIDLSAPDFEHVFVHHNKILNIIDFGINASIRHHYLKNIPLHLDASCNWWGSADPSVVQGLAIGDVNVFPYLLTDITDPSIEGYDCGGQPPLIPLSNVALIVAMMLMAGFMTRRLIYRS